MINKRIVILFLTIISTSATGFMHAQSYADLNDPKNYAWPYNIIVSVKRWFGTPAIKMSQKPPFMTRLSDTVKHVIANFYTQTPYAKNLNRAQMIHQAQTLLDQHLAHVSKFSNDTIAKALCHPIGLVWCQLAYGHTSTTLSQVKHLLRAAGLSTITARHIGQELFAQSRAAVKEPKAHALFRLFVPRKFDLTPLINNNYALQKQVGAPIEFQMNW